VAGIAPLNTKPTQGSDQHGTSEELDGDCFVYSLARRFGCVGSPG
jgi:hypothetical protein